MGLNENTIQYSKYSITLLIIITLIALVIRVAVLLPEVELRGDAGTRYDPIALNLVAGNGFSSETHPPFAPDSFDQPGYPYFVAAIYRLSNGSRKAVVIMQLILELGILLLVINTLRSLGFSRRVKLTALSLGLVCPFLPLFSATILTEILATFFVTLTCYLNIQAALTGHIKSIIFAGVASGASLLVRPDTLIVVVLMMIARGGVAWCYRQQRSFVEVSIISVTIVLVLLPWTIRNYYHFHSVRPLGGVTAQVKLAYSKWLDTWLDDPKYFETYWWHATDKEYTHEFPKHKIPADEREKAEYALALAKQQGSFAGQPTEHFIALANEAKQKRPFSTTIITPLRRTVMTWVRMPTYIHQNELKLLAYLFWLLLLLFVILGIIKVIKQNWSCLFLILFAVILGRLALPLISTLAIEPRYMIETLPVCFIFAAIGISQAHAQISPGASRQCLSEERQ